MQSSTNPQATALNSTHQLHTVVNLSFCGFIFIYVWLTKQLQNIVLQPAFVSPPSPHPESQYAIHYCIFANTQLFYVTLLQSKDGGRLYCVLPTGMLMGGGGEEGNFSAVRLLCMSLGGI